MKDMYTFMLYFENLIPSEKVDIYNHFCEKHNFDDKIYLMDNLDKMLEKCKPTEVLAKIDENFCRFDSAFIINNDNKFQSLNETNLTIYTQERMYFFIAKDIEIWSKYISPEKVQ